MLHLASGRGELPQVLPRLYGLLYASSMTDSKDKPKADNFIDLDSLPISGKASPEQLAKFKQLIASGMEIREAAARCGFSAAIQRKLVQKLALDADTELRLAIFEQLLRHISNNAPAAIFAAKAKLGWQDKQVIEQNQTVEYVDVPVSETRSAWEARQAKLRAIK